MEVRNKKVTKSTNITQRNVTDQDSSKDKTSKKLVPHLSQTLAP